MTKKKGRFHGASLTCWQNRPPPVSCPLSGQPPGSSDPSPSPRMSPGKEPPPWSQRRQDVREAPVWLQGQGSVDRKASVCLSWKLAHGQIKFRRNWGRDSGQHVSLMSLSRFNCLIIYWAKNLEVTPKVTRIKTVTDGALTKP